MSVVSQRFSRTSNAGGAPARENNVVSLGGAIGARGLPPGPDLRPCKSLTCSDAMRTGPNGRLRNLLRLNTADAQPSSDGHEGVAPARPVASRRSSSPPRIRAALTARPHHANYPAAAVTADLMNFLFNMVGDAVVVVADPRLIGSGVRGCDDPPVATTRLSAASPGPHWSSPARRRRLAAYTTSRRAPCSLRLCGLGDSPFVENRRGGGDPVGVALREAFPGVPTTSVLGAPEGVGHMRPPRLVGVP